MGVLDTSVMSMQSHAYPQDPQTMGAILYDAALTASQSFPPSSSESSLSEMDSPISESKNKKRKRSDWKLLLFHPNHRSGVITLSHIERYEPYEIPHVTLHVVTNHKNQEGRIIWMIVYTMSGVSNTMIKSPLDFLLIYHTFALLCMNACANFILQHLKTFLAPPPSSCSLMQVCYYFVVVCICMTRPTVCEAFSIAGCGGLLCLLFAFQFLHQACLVDSPSCTLHIVSLALILTGWRCSYSSTFETFFNFLYL